MARETKRGRGRGGAAARRAERSDRKLEIFHFIERKIPIYEILNEDGLAIIEANAETILAEIGIDFRDDAEALELWRQGGAEVDGERQRRVCRRECPLDRGSVRRSRADVRQRGLPRASA